MSVKLIRRACTLLLGVVVLLTTYLPCSAEDIQDDTQIVRVAYFDMGDYYRENESGEVVSYDRAYLNKISKYSKLRFQYVDCVTWGEALEMLKDHKVDLVGTAQWNAKREEQYCYCLESYGYTIGELATLPDKSVVYEDYDAIGKAVIGCTDNYVRNSEMMQVFEDHQISPKMKTYPDQKTLEDALRNGEIDMIAANSHALYSGWPVVEKFSYSPFYFISYKGNEELIDQIDDAIIQLNLQEPSYDDELLQEFFPTLLGAPLTKAERNLIAKDNIYTIYFKTDTKPILWYDNKNHAMRGALVDVCAQVSEATGLHLQVKPLQEKRDQKEDTSIVFTSLFYDSNENISQVSGVTDALLDENFNLFHRVGEAYDYQNEEFTIGVVKSRDRLKEYLEGKYPNCQVVSFDSPLECLKKLKSKEIDLTFLNVHVADYILTIESLDEIREVPTEDTRLGIAMYVTGEDSETVCSIINKGLQNLDYDEISNAMMQYALETSPKITVTSFLKDHFELKIMLVIVLLIIISAMTMVLTYALVMKKQRDKVEQADQDRSEFFARMSHDMRTPMNGILGMLTLSEQSDSIEDIHQNMEKAKSSGEYMLHLINDTLDLQRLETGRMQLNPEVVYSADYVENIMSMVRVDAEKKGITFRVKNKMDVEKYIEIDPVRVKQIFINLLSNAIKFTPESGTVEITMECLDDNQDGEVSHKKFTIRDTGIGMSKEFLENSIYKVYSQEHNDMTNQYAGSGLGLAITKNLVEMMNGRLEVESELGEGTTFTVYLDFKNVDKEIAQEQELKRKTVEQKLQLSLDGVRILLCEDHPLNAEIAKRLLQKVGCEVVWVENGKLGVENFASKPEGYYDVILMDIRMPEMDGLEATRQIRQLDREDACLIPIIAMTANAYDSDKQQAIEAGINEHLAKPINPAVLYKTIALLLNKI